MCSYLNTNNLTRNYIMEYDSDTSYSEVEYEHINEECGRNGVVCIKREDRCKCDIDEVSSIFTFITDNNKYHEFNECYKNIIKYLKLECCAIVALCDETKIDLIYKMIEHSDLQCVIDSFYMDALYDLVGTNILNVNRLDLVKGYADAQILANQKISISEDKQIYNMKQIKLKDMYINKLISTLE